MESSKPKGVVISIHIRPKANAPTVAVENVRPGLVHRGGLRAQILTEGEIRVGDSIGD